MDATDLNLNDNLIERLFSKLQEFKDKIIKHFNRLLQFLLLINNQQNLTVKLIQIMILVIVKMNFLCLELKNLMHQLNTIKL